MTGEQTVQFLKELLDSSIGPGIIAGLMIVLWDVVRIYVQSRWLVQKLNQKSECQRCQAISDQVSAIAEKLGVENDSGHSGSDQT